MLVCQSFEIRVWQRPFLKWPNLKCQVGHMTHFDLFVDWTLPLVILILPVLHLVKRQSFPCTLVVPDVWPCKFWWPLLQSVPFSIGTSMYTRNSSFPPPPLVFLCPGPQPGTYGFSTLITSSHFAFSVMPYHSYTGSFVIPLQEYLLFSL